MQNYLSPKNTPPASPVSSTPSSLHLVLIGGGHAHAIALNLWSNKPLPGVKLTLISDVQQTPYSGMLPGHVAGFYSYEETHINLANLCQLVGANLIIDRAINLDLANNEVICQNHNPISFDYLSIDIGSTPNFITVPGAQDYAIPAKPVPQFLDAWRNLLATVKNKPQSTVKLVIVGGGAGGVELALNMQAHLIKEIGKNNVGKLQIHLIHRGYKLLSEHNPWVSEHLHKILLKKGIILHLKTQVIAVKSHHIICDNQENIAYDYLFWVTQASAPQWIKKSQLTTDSQGFILVKDSLCSVSHPHIFATGDIATMKNYARPKAGVFAVRQGQPLFTNWQNTIKGEPLKSYIPQKRYLALIGTGDKKAIASWGSWGCHSSLFWLLKDYIDRKFMNLFKIK